LSPERSSHQYLLDFDVELAEELDVQTRLVARSAVTAVIFEADTGQVRLSDWLAMAGSGPGVLVLDGVLAIGVHVGDRIAAELVGTGDLIQPWRGEDEELLACAVDWRALVPSRFALLDAGVADGMARWPQLGFALLRRVGRRTRRVNVQRAIAAQPRLEVRLALLLWHLAARWGKVAPGGIRLSLPLTHQMLGRLIAAERPSVSHALARLAESGLVTGHGDEWHLHGSLEKQLAAMFEPAPPAGRLVPPDGRRATRNAQLLHRSFVPSLGGKPASEKPGGGLI
jgi:CRP/FNR family transcriptional regulator, cyclic AMP receptor protein